MQKRSSRRLLALDLGVRRAYHSHGSTPARLGEQVVFLYNQDGRTACHSFNTIFITNYELSASAIYLRSFRYCFVSRLSHHAGTDYSS